MKRSRIIRVWIQDLYNNISSTSARVVTRNKTRQFSFLDQPLGGKQYTNCMYSQQLCKVCKPYNSGMVYTTIFFAIIECYKKFWVVFITVKCSVNSLDNHNHRFDAFVLKAKWLWIIWKIQGSNTDASSAPIEVTFCNLSPGWSVKWGNNCLPPKLEGMRPCLTTTVKCTGLLIQVEEHVASSPPPLLLRHMSSEPYYLVWHYSSKHRVIQLLVWGLNVLLPPAPTATSFSSCCCSQFLGFPPSRAFASCSCYRGHGKGSHTCRFGWDSPGQLVKMETKDPELQGHGGSLEERRTSTMHWSATPVAVWKQ